MQIPFSRRVGLQFLAVVLGLLAVACTTFDPGLAGSPGIASRWEQQVVYSRVGMRVEPSKLESAWHMYSSNHIGLLKHIPAGTKFTVQRVGNYTLELVAEDSSTLLIEFVARHHPDLLFDGWVDRQFSTSPVNLSSGLSSSEREAIREGRYQVGISRKALFHSIGFPPASISPNLEGGMLTYELKRFNRVVFTFDDENRISGIRN